MLGGDNVRGAILNKGEFGYTLMRRIFNAINQVQRNYNWLITDVNAYPNDPIFEKLVNEEYMWMTGDELTKMVEKEDFQWIWAVFSGFSPDINKEAIFEYKLPNVQENYDVWKNQPRIQHPLANIEILACDSSYVTIVSKHDSIVNDFMNFFKYSIDLDTYLEKISTSLIEN